MYNVTWEEFLRCCNRIINVSNKLDDNWRLEGDSKTPGGVYLKRIKYLPHKSELGRHLRWEHHICYNLSYGVPVMYFNVFDSSGLMLPLSQIWKYCRELADTARNVYFMLTQQDHPVLMRPFCMIHPCKTHEFLESDKCSNVLVKFITSLGPLVELFMDNEYGKEEQMQ